MWLVSLAITRVQSPHGLGEQSFQIPTCVLKLVEKSPNAFPDTVQPAVGLRIVLLFMIHPFLSPNIVAMPVILPWLPVFTYEAFIADDFTISSKGEHFFSRILCSPPKLSRKSSVPVSSAHSSWQKISLYQSTSAEDTIPQIALYFKLSRKPPKV